MAHTLSSRGDQSQAKGYSSPYDRSPNPLPAHNSTVHTSNSSSISCFSGSRGIEFRDKYVVEGLSPYSSCSSSYHSVGSPSGWQLSNPNSDVHFLSSNKNLENSTGLVDLSAAQLQIPHDSSHVQCTSSDFTANKFDNGSWQQLLDPTNSYMSTMPAVLPTSTCLALPESTGAPAMVEGAMLRELLGRLDNNNCSSSITSLGTTLATGSTQHLGSPMATGGCSWNQVDSSSNMGLTVDSSTGGLSHHGAGLTTPHLAQFSSDPGFVERAARFSSFSNIAQLCQSLSSSGAVNMNLSPEASQFLDNSTARQTSMTPSCTPQSSPKVNCNMNASNNFPTCENAGKLESFRDLVHKADTAAEDAGDGMRYRSAGCHSEMAIDETKSLQNGASPANSSGSGQYAALHGLMASKGLMDTQGKKRQKCISEEKAKEVPCLSETSKKKMDEMKSKRQRSSEGSKIKEELKSKVEKSSSENSGNSSPSSAKENPKPPEPPKQDYIHVRARRGQATDSHSLAERVRREKISERMKFLQDLVPGCSKVTGKALMLDEIINYVQSLQRQVEFLSMKLAAVNPRLDFNIENLLTKEMLSSLCPTPALLLGPDNATNILQLHPTQPNPIQLGLSSGLDLSSSGNAVETTLRRSMTSPIAIDTYANSGSQTSGVWDGELQSVVQMGFGSGNLPPGQMKVEL
ncbi:hypothetical protein O6H91_02G002700 [Diphasiastrum complanatum]|uniref:Uncharacterized protein n=2 Tax=Diphasiastrum complanatum TaxID=34168 RepID=A0ACC2EC91_DIPCM|nr:hypothetical protein O6H91_02G002300 [Diphasiastrum complanatum]KAJ7564113.1 hypothetical protein O6H91_02G002700 [Diphasiastrum complanatum]